MLNMRYCNINLVTVCDSYLMHVEHMMADALICRHIYLYCKFNRRLNGFNCKVDRSVMSGIQHTKQEVVS